MDFTSILLERFHLPSQHLKALSSDRHVCLVQEDWLRHALQGGIESFPRSLEKSMCEQLLASSLSSLPQPWLRITIKTVLKSDSLVNSLSEGPLFSLNPKLSFTELMAHISRENFSNFWQAAHTKYSHALQREEKRPTDKFTNVFRQWVMRLQPLAFLDMENPESETNRPFTGHEDNSVLLNVVPVLALFETSQYFFVFQPFFEHSLHDIVHFSPALFASSHAKVLFVTYQILQILRVLHDRGLHAGDLNLQNVRIDKKLWVYLSTPQQGQLVKIPLTDDQGDSRKENKPQLLVRETTSQLVTDPVPSAQKPLSPLSQLIKSTPLSKAALSLNSARQFLNQNIYTMYTTTDLPKVVDEWVNHRLSNFQYLMILNYLAGRRMNDPNNHPVLPWIMDFSHPDEGYRDLSMSKYRLNKGDRQLDIMYESIPLLGSSASEPTLTQTPHHISDVLSDITYYVYKARITPKSILCAHVRTKWVPNEYPSSMQRLQDWTPDECIPEFFTDPTVFTTIHEDLPDLEMPAWCYSPRDFVEKHLAVLESDHVSSRLHQWIDLTFGYQLSSQAAVNSKNVYLHLADQHTGMINHGVVQLFEQAHPVRNPPLAQATSHPPVIIQNNLHQMLITSKFEDEVSESAAQKPVQDIQPLQPTLNLLQVPGENQPYGEAEPSRRRPSGSESSPLLRPENSQIRLPPEYEPLASLEQLESFYNFTLKTMQCLPPSSDSQPLCGSRLSIGRQYLVWRDMQALGCLLAELFFAPMLRMSNPCSSLQDRYALIVKLHKDHVSLLPRPIQYGITTLLQLEKTNDLNSTSDSNCLFYYDEMSNGGLPPPNPSLLLNPSVDVFPFPAHFSDLYDCLCAMQQKDFQINKVKLGNLIIPEKVRLVKVLARDKVILLEKFLARHQMKLSSEELEVLLPYIDELFENPDTSVQAAWHLFNIVAKIVGPKEGKKIFLKFLTTLLSGENSTPKHMKLYHRVFLMQIIIRLGMQTFLNNFSTLLVEAVAGYKDFMIGGDPDLTEDDIQDESQQSETDIEPSPNSFTDPEQTDSASDSDVDNNVSMVTAFSNQEGREETEEDFPDNLSIGNDTGDDERHSASQEDSSESSEARVSLSSLSQDTTADAESDALRYGIGSAGKESIHSLSRLIEITKSNRDTTVGSDMESDYHGDVFSVFDNGPPSFSLDSEISVDDGDETEGHRKRSNTVEFHTPASEIEADSPNKSQKKPSMLYSPHMVRSETDEFRSVYSKQSGEHTQHSNICDVSADSIKWLSVRLGPLLTAKYLSRNLIRMLGLCYLGDEQLETLPDQLPDVFPMQSCQLVTGDRNVWKVLDCLGWVAMLYGERVVLSQFFPCIQDMISVAMKRITVRAEAGLIGAVVLLRYATQFLSDSTLMDILQDTLIQEMLLPVIKLASISSVSFPSGPLPRTILCYKIVDVIYILGLRIGFEMTRKHMTILLQKFFASFDVVHAQPKPDVENSLQIAPSLRKVASGASLSGLSLSSTDETYLNIKIDTETQEYSIGTPVSVSYLGNTSSPSNTGSWRQQYSLSPAQDDREEPYETKIANKERIMGELTRVFSPELAFTSYIPLCRIFGSIHIEQHLKNDDLIRQLCTQHDQSLARQNSLDSGPGSPHPGSPLSSPVIGEIGSNVAVVGNRIQLQNDTPSPTLTSESSLNKTFQRRGILAVDQEKLRCTEMDLNTGRHLKGNWLAYWEHELGLSERDTMFNFKQIKLQTFLGHNNSIRALCVMNNENSFISASKDKTVKLWSLRSDGDGSAKSRCQWSYSYHKKSVFSVAFIETMRYMASCDSTVHIWDPFTAMVISQLDSSKHQPVLALAPLPAPNPHLMTATTEGILRFIDLRVPRYAHEFRCNSNSSGLIRCVAVSPSADWVAIGYSTGLISVLDLRTGLLMGAWKGHDGEILQIKAFNKHSFVTSSFDQTMKLWRVDDGKDICQFRGPTEPVHCFNFYNSQIISATTANKIGVHSSVDAVHTFSSTRLRSDTFKGVLTCMNILPMNRALILGADNGTIRLIC